MIPFSEKRVRGSRTGKPVMAFLDLIGHRWALRVLWEMRSGPARFRDLETACGASPTVINRRLGELKAWDLVELTEDGYALTSSAKELLALLLPLNAWCERQAKNARTRSARPKAVKARFSKSLSVPL
jgi:DNA-binding HxlR family transcriptional regulator